MEINYLQYKKKKDLTPYERERRQNNILFRRAINRYQKIIGDALSTKKAKPQEPPKADPLAK